MSSECKYLVPIIIIMYPIIMYMKMWNRELAQAALNFSLLCRLASNPERASQVPAFDTVGEVWSAIGTRSRPNYTAVVNIAWFNQRSMYSFESNTCSTENACLFYTQVSAVAVITNQLAILLLCRVV